MGYAGVTQDLLNNLGILPLFEHEGGESVSEIVGASGRRQAGFARERLKIAPDQVVPVHRTTSLRGKDKVLVSPEPRAFESLFGLNEGRASHRGASR